MAEITLIVPPFSSNRLTPRLTFDEIPNIGVGYLAEHVRRLGHRVSVIDGVGEGLGRVTRVRDRDFVLPGLPPDVVVDRVPEDTEIIGVSYQFSRDWKVCKDLLHRLRRRFPRALLVVGGEAATADTEFMLRAGVGVDLGVRGEGEETLAEIAADPETARGRSIPGTAQLLNERYVEHPSRRRMKIPAEFYPAWDLFPIEAYMRFRSGMSIVNRATLPIMASRGCPYACTFCTSPQMWGTQYLVRDPDEIVREMRHFHERYANDHFVFIDLATTIKRDWTIQLGQAIVDSHLKIGWHFGPGTRTEVMDAETIPLLQRAGLVKMGFASESGSEETLKKVHKRTNLARMLEAMRVTVKLRLPARTTFIFGFPGQSLRECVASLIFALRLAWIGFDEVTVLFFTPYPGSELHQELVRRRAIPDKVAEPARYEKFLEALDLHNLATRTWGERSALTLQAFYLATHGGFLVLSLLLHPRKLLRAFRNIRRRRPVTNFEGLIFNHLHAPARRASGEIAILA